MEPRFIMLNLNAILLLNKADKNICFLYFSHGVSKLILLYIDICIFHFHKIWI